MKDQRVVIVNADPTLQTQFEHHCAATPYTPYAQPWSADTAARLAATPPAAIVVHVPCALEPEEAGVLLARLQTDTALRQIPVVVCSERPAVLQSTVQALQPRPGVVLASATEVREVVSKLQAADQVGRYH